MTGTGDGSSGPPHGNRIEERAMTGRWGAASDLVDAPAGVPQTLELTSDPEEDGDVDAAGTDLCCSTCRQPGTTPGPDRWRTVTIRMETAHMTENGTAAAGRINGTGQPAPGAPAAAGEET